MKKISYVKFRNNATYLLHFIVITIFFLSISCLTSKVINSLLMIKVLFVKDNMKATKIAT